jgi:hypothetical protein
MTEYRPVPGEKAIVRILETATDAGMRQRERAAICAKRKAATGREADTPGAANDEFPQVLDERDQAKLDTLKDNIAALVRMADFLTVAAKEQRAAARAASAEGAGKAEAAQLCKSDLALREAALNLGKAERAYQAAISPVIHNSRLRRHPLAREWAAGARAFFPKGIEGSFRRYKDTREIITDLLPTEADDEQRLHFIDSWIIDNAGPLLEANMSQQQVRIQLLEWVGDIRSDEGNDALAPVRAALTKALGTKQSFNKRLAKLGLRESPQ